MTADENLRLLVAGLLVRHGRGLLLHRTPARVWYPDCWDLPGGHVEVGETSETALQRELREELGIVAFVTGEPLAHIQGADFRMDIWTIDEWRGEPANMDLAEHDALAWLNADELGALKLADPRLPTLFDAALNATS